jgi:hypothetical protein
VLVERGTAVRREGLDRMRQAGSTLIDRVRAIVLIEVIEARAVVSPAYDGGAVAEADMVRMFQARFARLHPPA